MTEPIGAAGPIWQSRTSLMLQELGIPAHRIGYRQLSAAIPRYARDNVQSLTKELYPAIARQFGQSSWSSVEHAVRLAILDGWKQGRPEIWEAYFHSCRKPPSNKLFIATLAERLKQITPPE